VQAFLRRPLQVCSRAVVVAMGVNADGRRELLGLKLGDSESEGFWSEFNFCAVGKAYDSLKERGLTRVCLMVSQFVNDDDVCSVKAVMASERLEISPGLLA